VSPEPDIREAPVNTTQDFLLICSDGIWNSMKEKVVLRFVKQRLASGQQPAEVCRDLCKGERQEWFADLLGSTK
jgi:serine/threonine protein phosphatase PrpC